MIYPDPAMAAPLGSPSPSRAHRRLAGEIVRWLVPYAESHGYPMHVVKAALSVAASDVEVDLHRKGSSNHERSTSNS